MKAKRHYYITTFLFLFLSLHVRSQVSLTTLQKLALLNTDDLYALSERIPQILEPVGFEHVGPQRWLRENGTYTKEIITLVTTSEGVQVSYTSYNLQKTKATIEAIKKLGNFSFNNKDESKTNFRNADKKLIYEALYTNNYSRCTIAVVPKKDR